MKFAKVKEHAAEDIQRAYNTERTSLKFMLLAGIQRAKLRSRVQGSKYKARNGYKLGIHTTTLGMYSLSEVP